MCNEDTARVRIKNRWVLRLMRDCACTLAHISVYTYPIEYRKAHGFEVDVASQK